MRQKHVHLRVVDSTPMIYIGKIAQPRLLENLIGGEYSAWRQARRLARQLGVKAFRHGVFDEVIETALPGDLVERRRPRVGANAYFILDTNGSFDIRFGGVDGEIIRTSSSEEKAWIWAWRRAREERRAVYLYRWSELRRQWTRYRAQNFQK